MNKPRILDCHQHVRLHSSMPMPATAAEVETGWAAEGWFAADVAARLETMARNGIEGTVLMPGFGYPQPRGAADTRALNDALLRYRSRSPGKFRWLIGTVEPLHGAVALEELRRLRRSGQFHGVAWHHRFQGCAIDHPMMPHLLKELADWGAPAFVHTNAESRLEAPWRLEQLARSFPSLRFVALDPFASHAQMEELIPLAERCRNIFFDTALMVLHGPVVRRLVQAMGAERLLFGSNLYDGETYVHSAPLRAIYDTDLGEAERDRILGGNLLALLEQAAN